MKTKFKGSEGKWTSNKKHAIRNNSGLICSLYYPNKYLGQEKRYEEELEVMRANQKLIVNAPEMLDILCEIENKDSALPELLLARVKKVLEETLT